MLLSRFLKPLQRFLTEPVSSPVRPNGGGAARTSYRPRCEALEDRSVPAIAVTPGLTALQLAQALVGTGSGVTITGATLTDSSGLVKAPHTGAEGTFTGGLQPFGFDSGIVLSTGKAADLVGPNNSSNKSTDWGLGGDPALNAAAGITASSHDAINLTISFIPQGGKVSFQYVFGSEEYPEFVGSQFNDAFAFLLNGTNVALLPDGSPVAINNVNAGKNSAFFKDNNGNNVGGTSPFDTQLDGLTTVLTAAGNVNAGKVNTISLIIEDVGDGIYDSDVMIKAGSFQSAVKAQTRVFYPYHWTVNPATGVTSGFITIFNLGTDLMGPTTIALSNLPPGVTVANANGTTAQGAPTITVNQDFLHSSPLKVFVQFNNPLHKQLTSYQLGFQVDVFGFQTN